MVDASPLPALPESRLHCNWSRLCFVHFGSNSAFYTTPLSLVIWPTINAFLCFLGGFLLLKFTYSEIHTMLISPVGLNLTLPRGQLPWTFQLNKLVWTVSKRTKPLQRPLCRLRSPLLWTWRGGAGPFPGHHAGEGRPCGSAFSLPA